MKHSLYTIIFILATGSFSSACVPLIAAGGVAGVGAGGYYAGSKGSDRDEARIKAKAESDALKQIEEQKQAAKAADQAIANNIAMNYSTGQLTEQVAIYPQVQDGTVVLYGRAPNQAVAQNAIRVASQTPGVKRIVSNIQVIPNAPAAIYQQPAYTTGYMAVPAAAVPAGYVAAQPMMANPAGQPQTIQPNAQPVMPAPKSKNPAVIQKQSQMGLVPTPIPAPAPASEKKNDKSSQVQTGNNAKQAAVKPIKPLPVASTADSEEQGESLNQVYKKQRKISNDAAADAKKDSVSENKAGKKPPIRPKENDDQYTDADSEYIEYQPTTLRKNSSTNIKQSQKPAVSQQSSQAALENSPPAAVPQPIINIPAPIITEENDSGYIEYRGAYVPPVPLVHTVIPARSANGTPLNIQVPVATEDNDAFYQQLYNQ